MPNDVIPPVNQIDDAIQPRLVDDVAQDYLLAEAFKKQRRRRITFGIRGTNDNLANGGMDWPDAVTSSDIFQAAMPLDWIWGTDLYFMISVLSLTTGTTQIVWNSKIGIEGCNRINTGTAYTYTDTNMESTGNMINTVVKDQPRLLVRQISAATLSANLPVPPNTYDMRAQWQVQRVGGNVNDTVNASLRYRSAWLEYYSTYDHTYKEPV